MLPRGREGSEAETEGKFVTADRSYSSCNGLCDVGCIVRDRVRVRVLGLCGYVREGNGVRFSEEGEGRGRIRRGRGGRIRRRGRENKEGGRENKEGGGRIRRGGKG